jgi:hypothetical protein
MVAPVATSPPPKTRDVATATAGTHRARPRTALAANESRNRRSTRETANPSSAGGGGAVLNKRARLA